MTPVLLVSIDGVRPDALRKAEAPCIHQLAAEGAYTWTARSVVPSVTLPCHTSIFRGVDVPRHGITTNTFMPLARPVPSVLDLATAHGKRCGMFYNWGELRDVCAPGSLAVSYLHADCYSADGDRRVAELAVEHIERENLDLVFLYLGWTDECGHQYGWMSDEYLAAIADADRCVAQVRDAYPGDVTTIVLSDHGGHERTHGTEMDEDMLVPWIAHGPGIRAKALTGTVRLFDSAPTVAGLLGFAPPREWEGRDILAE